MSIRERLRETMKKRAEGTVSSTGKYLPPGARIRMAGDLIAALGTIGLVMPLLNFAKEYPYPPLYAGIHSGLNFGIWLLAPFVASVYVWVIWFVSDWRARIGTVVIGLLGTAASWEFMMITYEWLFAAGEVPRWEELFLSFGNPIVLIGGLVSLPAAYFGAWAMKHDFASL